MAALFGPVPARSAPARASEIVNGHRAAPGELLIRYRQPLQGLKLSRLNDPDIDRERPVGIRGWRVIHSYTRSAATLLQDMAGRSEIAAVEPNYELHAAGSPDDLAPALWALQNTGQTLSNGAAGTPGADINAVSAWDTTTGSSSIVVATIDSGIMSTHEDLAANVWSAPSDFTVTIGGNTITCPAGTHGFNAITSLCAPADDNGHGTHVAGSIGAVGGNALGVVGVNWTTSIMALKFLDSTGTGYVSNAIDAIDFAIQAKAAFAATGDANVRVLNNSWTGGAYSQALADEIAKAADADMLFVAAAGNNGSDNGAQPTYPASYEVRNVIPIAATDYNDQLASFSNYSDTAVPLAAPGVSIYSTAISPNSPAVSSYMSMSGTSMAAAYASGVAALVLAHCPYSTAALRNALLASATSLPSLAGKVASGRRLNAAGAVTSCDSSTATSTPGNAPSDIVLYASDLGASDVHGTWTLEQDGSAAGGSMLATPDSGWSTPDAPLSTPSDYFEASFQAPAGVPYHLWLRLRAASDSRYNDSVWVQFSDALVDGSPAYAINTTDGLAVNLENCSECGESGWGWQDHAYWLAQSPVVTFTSDGAHTLRIQTREDGVIVDQIVLGSSAYLSTPPGAVTSDSTIVPKGATSTTSGSGAPAGTLAPFGGSPATLPGIIDAANFDNGGEGVAYHDTTAANLGGAYRNTDVDIEPSSDGGYDVGWTDAGEWLNYTVNVPTAGSYIVHLRVASPNGSSLHVGFNQASNVWTTVTVPASGGWQSWTTVDMPVTLGAGAQQLTIQFDTGGTNLRSIEVDAAP